MSFFWKRVVWKRFPCPCLCEAWDIGASTVANPGGGSQTRVPSSESEPESRDRGNSDMVAEPPRIPARAELEDKTCDELRKLLRKHGLETGGVKDALVKRLIKARKERKAAGVQNKEIEKKKTDEAAPKLRPPSALSSEPNAQQWRTWKQELAFWRRTMKGSHSEEAMRFPCECYACRAPGETRMCITSIPHFREIIIMAFSCDKVSRACAMQPSQSRASPDAQLHVSDEKDDSDSESHVSTESDLLHTLR